MIKEGDYLKSHFLSCYARSVKIEGRRIFLEFGDSSDGDFELDFIEEEFEVMSPAEAMAAKLLGKLP